MSNGSHYPLDDHHPARWWSLEIRCHPELTKAAIWRLKGPGHRVCTVMRGDSDRLWAFVDRDYCPPGEVSQLFLGLLLDAEQHQLPKPQVNWEAVSSWDWPEEIREFLIAREIGNRLVLLQPTEENPNDERIPIWLDGRYGFGGVGVHPTTRLCLEALERHLPDPPEVQKPVLADIGCGVGVLSIAAVLLGAKMVYAVDTKAASVSATQINCELNDIPADSVIVVHCSSFFYLTRDHGRVSRLYSIHCHTV